MIHFITHTPAKVGHFTADVVRGCCRKLVQLCKKIQKIWNAFVNKIKNACITVKGVIPGAKHRITTGDEYTAWLPHHLRTQNGFNEHTLIKFMEKFAGYDYTTEAYYHANPLNQPLRDKMEELIKGADFRAPQMRQLLERCENSKFSRKKFDGDDTIALERASFELVKEFMYDLKNLSNSGCLKHIQQDIQTQFKFDYYESVIGEILARSVAYNSHLDGMVMPLPVKGEDGTYGLFDFTIRQYHLGDELPAYVLECKDDDGKDLCKPWFAVRGTEPGNPKTREGTGIRRGSMESLMADVIHAEGVGEGVVERCIDHKRSFEDGEQESLRELMEGRQFNLCGHSLGGNIVNQIAAYLYDDIHQVFGFSAPGVSKKKAELWEKNSQGDEANKLINFQVEGDLVPAAGHRLIGTQLALTHLMKPKKTDAVHMHVLMCLTKPFKLQLIDKAAEEKQPGRKVIEFTRRSIGVLFKKIFRKLLHLKLPEWYLQRNIFAIPLTGHHHKPLVDVPA
jgi:hypothetical protein